MRIDSCRKCGNELEVNKKCNVCREASQLACNKCGNITDEQIHIACNNSISNSVFTSVAQ